MDIAVSWADSRVFDIVKTKWDTLPVISDKKGDKKGAKKASGKTTSPNKVRYTYRTFVGP